MTMLITLTLLALFLAGGFALSWAVSTLERIEQDMRRSVDR